MINFDWIGVAIKNPGMPDAKSNNHSTLGRVEKEQRTFDEELQRRAQVFASNQHSSLMKTTRVAER